ncbi:DUF6777 domain-containing protein [Streptomyces sp. TRM64462]|uniref:DUF6777 domain-containing protein n=1 Tax=Streptomyces sp. TRM64462 TaxID=2741726 RepID=UPI0015864C42|nr:DUF6777 domain-containing protein [Streptomyces sp. TRM64462]
MRPPTRRRSGALAAALAAAGLLAAGCGGDGTPSEAAGTPEGERTILLQAAAATGPDPFTASTSLTADVAQPRRASAGTSPPSPAVPPPPMTGAAGPPLRTVDGATPGLYGGTQSLPSCDVDQQARFLTADRAKADAFAEAAGVTPGGLADWLRGLTPVMLRADTRVTGHGYRDGAATPYQAVLQAGTAVLVDAYGAPRVRCACGNPIRTPDDDRHPAAQRGRPWEGYRPDRVVVVTPTQRALDSLILVNVLNDTWLERKVGTRGEQDRTPEVPPAYDPGERHVAERAVPDALRPAAPPPDVGLPDGGIRDGTVPDGGMPDGAESGEGIPEETVPDGPPQEPASFDM